MAILDHQSAGTFSQGAGGWFVYDRDDACELPTSGEHVGEHRERQPTPLGVIECSRETRLGTIAHARHDHCPDRV
jgi:hypothetical protein